MSPTMNQIGNGGDASPRDGLGQRTGSDLTEIGRHVVEDAGGHITPAKPNDTVLPGIYTGGDCCMAGRGLGFQMSHPGRVVGHAASHEGMKMVHGRQARIVCSKAVHDYDNQVPLVGRGGLVAIRLDFGPRAEECLEPGRRHTNRGQRRDELAPRDELAVEEPFQFRLCQTTSHATIPSRSMPQPS